MMFFWPSGPNLAPSFGAKSGGGAYQNSDSSLFPGRGSRLPSGRHPTQTTAQLIRGNYVPNGSGDGGKRARVESGWAFRTHAALQGGRSCQRPRWAYSSPPGSPPNSRRFHEGWGYFVTTNLIRHHMSVLEPLCLTSQ